MKFAVISDIHANFQALEAVVEDLKNQGCEKVLCLGDLALAGPQPRMVIDYVRNQKDWIVIQGNTDALIANFSKELFENVKSVFPVMANALVDDVFILEDDKKEYLKQLSPNKELEIEGVKILLVHGSPRRNNEDILPDMQLDEIESMIDGVSADLIFCGHTHVPCGYQTVSKKTVVNVGSVGRPMTEIPKACYAVVEAFNGEFTIEHRFVDYDRETAALLVKARNFEGCDKLAEMILHPTQRHV